MEHEMYDRIVFSARRMGVLLLVCILFISGGCFWKKKAPDKTPTARELYEQGVKLVEGEKYEQARDIFNKVKVMGTETDLELLAQIAVADSYFEQKEYEAALALYKDMFKLHSGSPVADYLLYRMGDCHFWQIDTIDRDPTHARKALEDFNRLQKDFPDSEYLSPAKLRIKQIHAFLAKNEFFIGEFYLRKNALFAAINRFKKALDLYPESGIEDKLIYYLYKTYKTLKDEEHVDEYRNLLLRRYPNSEYVPLVTDLQGKENAAGPPLAEQGAGLQNEVPSPGLAGTYQGKDRDSWVRSLLLLRLAKTCDRNVKCKPRATPPRHQALAKRSFVEKLIPW
jgi:outer membrane protein assembly factor BamD